MTLSKSGPPSGQRLIKIEPKSHPTPVHTFTRAQELEDELRRFVKGEVHFDRGARALYATDASNYRQVPIAVVVPRDAEDAIATMRICREFQAPVLSRGGGTSLAGQCCNVAVVLDFSKYMKRILAIDYQNGYARVEPGIVLDVLRKKAEEQHLTFGPDPATHSHCTIGGMIGNNSCGVHALMAGKTVDNILELDILTYDGLQMRVGETSEEELRSIILQGGRRGDIYAGLKDLRDTYAPLIRDKYPKIPRRVSGYNLDSLLPENNFNVAQALVGSESTLVMVLAAKCKLVHSPPYRALAVVGYPSIFEAADNVPEILELAPIGLEGIDNHLVNSIWKKKHKRKDLQLLPEGQGWLLVEFGAESQGEADERALEMMARLKKASPSPSIRVYHNKQDEKRVWEIRESALGATSFVPGEPFAWEGWEDSAVPPARLGEYLRAFRGLLQNHKYHGIFYGHFGQGCLHTRIDFDLLSEAGIRRFRAFIEEAADLVVSYGGSLSGEHGDGQSRAELLPKMFGPELIQAFRKYKEIWDPEWKMNPGKIVEPYKIDENLRLGADYRPWRPETHFKFPEDKGLLSDATMRCVGVGKCRRQEGGVMCPSYRVTLDEKHSTRGRAHLLWEMLQGEVIEDGWRSEAVKDALDLCLSCKGCKGECPVNVDIATYKAEFMSHYYEFKSRPLNAYAFGWIDKWARIASMAPGAANFLSHAPGVSHLAKSILKIPQQRELPALAPYTFRRWFMNRPKRPNQGSPEVVLWADTFNNYFHPETAQAAVEVLEAAGYTVRVPRRHLCCGRPLYDFGFLPQAKRYLLDVLDTLQGKIEQGVPVVVLEPSCASVFRDELKNLLPHHSLADTLSRHTYLLSEFLEAKAPGFYYPPLRGRAILQGHCHQQALMKMDSETAVLTKVLDVELLDSGCCGMAGPFGFEADKYEVSQACGERLLLPAVRKADDKTWIVADGFSCREQIAQNTDRRALHLAEVLQMALQHKQPEGKPENEWARKKRSTTRIGRLKTIVALIGLGIGFGLLCFRKKR